MGLKRVRKGGKIFYEPINKDPRRGEGNQVLIKDNFADKKVKGKMDVGVVIVDYINQVKRSVMPSRGGQYDWTEQIEVCITGVPT